MSGPFEDFWLVVQLISVVAGVRISCTRQNHFSGFWLFVMIWAPNRSRDGSQQIIKKQLKWFLQALSTLIDVFNIQALSSLSVAVISKWSILYYVWQFHIFLLTNSRFHSFLHLCSFPSRNWNLSYQWHNPSHCRSRSCGHRPTSRRSLWWSREVSVIIH